MMNTKMDPVVITFMGVSEGLQDSHPTNFIAPIDHTHNLIAGLEEYQFYYTNLFSLVLLRLFQNQMAGAW